MFLRVEQLLAAIMFVGGVAASPIATNLAKLQATQLAKREEGFIFVDCGNYSAANVSVLRHPTYDAPRQSPFVLGALSLRQITLNFTYLTVIL